MDVNYRLIFQTLLILTLIQRLYELVLAKKNETFILSLGGMIVRESNYFFMVFLHASWLLFLLYYAFFMPLDFSPVLFFCYLFLFLTGQLLRILAIKTLGRRWSTRIVILPGEKVINRGIFRYFRHPNYLGVVLELASLPLMAGLIKISLVYGLANFVILFFRIKLEEASLKKHTDYACIFELKGSAHE